MKSGTIMKVYVLRYIRYNEDCGQYSAEGKKQVGGVENEYP